MRSLAVITARGGSKRIPGKNKKLFLGKPILCYSIEAAISSKVFDEIMVSTDDEEIAEIARASGACVPFMRSSAASGDFAITNDVLLEVLDEYEKRGQFFDFLACIYPTAPFVTAQKLKDAFALLQESRTGCVMPVVAFSFPPQRGMILENDRLVYCHPENRTKRSQDFPKIYHDCGQFYFYQVDKIRGSHGIFSEGYTPLFMDETEVQDIDDLTDWKLAELKYQLMQGK